MHTVEIASTPFIAKATKLSIIATKFQSVRFAITKPVLDSTNFISNGVTLAMSMCMKIRLKQKRLHGMSCRVLNAEKERVNGVALNVKMSIVLNVSQNSSNW